MRKLIDKERKCRNIKGYQQKRNDKTKKEHNQMRKEWYNGKEE